MRLNEESRAGTIEGFSCLTGYHGLNSVKILRKLARNKTMRTVGKRK